MLRLVCSLALGAALASAARAADDGLKPGEPYKGEIPEEKISVAWVIFGGIKTEYGVKVPLKLRSGQKISFEATVVGANRTVSIGLHDPTGKVVAVSRDGVKKTTTLSVPEVSATGTYTVIVLSDAIGDFKLTVTGPSATELDAKTLEAEIADLKALLAKKEAALKALKAKKP
jgi:hypothetical protein